MKLPNWPDMGRHLTLGVLLLLALCELCAPVDAKTHHSKRQAPSFVQPSGRETTNWWNLWWQQYINEAVQPTARPIVGVIYNGRSISLQDEGAGDVETNFVDPTSNSSEQGSLDLPGANIELERSNRLRAPAEHASLPDNMHPFAAKQLASRNPSASQQANWQSVRPTIIQMPSGQSRAARRQADAFQAPSDEMQPDELGIQMRVRPKTSKVVQQAEDSRFEQQQNQMIDYGEDGEPDMDNLVGGTMMGSDADRMSKPAADSSSSSMMTPGEPPSARVPETPARPRLQPAGPSSVSDSGMPTSQGTSTTPRSTEPTTRKPSTATSSSSSPSSTSTSSTTTSSPIITVTEIDLNETPISIEPVSSRTTPSGGRVELMNGRPAPGMRQQMPSTNSVRLPSSTTSTMQSTSVESTTPNVRPEMSETTVGSTTSPTMTSSTTTTPSSSSPSSTEAATSSTPTPMTSTEELNRGSTGAPSSTMSGVESTTEADSTDDEETDSAEPTDRPSMNAAGDPSEEEESEEDEGDSGDTQTTTSQTNSESSTTPRPITSVSTSTQLPTVANIEIQRLPKMDPKPSSAGSADRPSANLVMTNLADEMPATMGGATDDPGSAISMPMDALVRMMLMNQMLEDERRKPLPPVSPPTATLSTTGSTPRSEVDQEMSMRRKPQPPPTTKLPSMVSTNQAMVSPPAQPSPAPTRFMTIRVESPAAVSPSGEEMDPKVELLNLDLMPIQRIMTAQDRQSKVPQSVQVQEITERPAQMGSSTMMITNGRQPMGVIEPGMRLRPVTASPPAMSKQTSMLPSIVGVKMIGKQQPAAMSGSAHTKRPAGEPVSDSRTMAMLSTSTITPPSSPTRATMSNVRSTQAPRVMSTQAGGSDIKESSNSATTKSMVVDASQPTMMDSSGGRRTETLPSQQMTSSFSMSTTQIPITSVGPGGSSSSTTGATETTPTTVTSTTSTTGAASSTRDSGTSAESTTVTSARADENRSTTPTSLIPTSTAQLPSTSTSASSATSTSSTSTTTTTTTTTTANPKTIKLERLQQIAANATEKRPATKSGATKAINKVNNSTISNSFIPNKLRSDFGKFSPTKTSNSSSQVLSTSGQKIKPTQEPTTQSPVQAGMAIRQFGGANRMSVLANQPVPFGRPAAMQPGGRSQRFELPSFEYGPAIAVRRPDEPLANGQMPNCTLTGKNFCVLTKDYPMNEVRQAVERSFRSVRIMYEELQTVSDQELHKEDFVNATSSQAASGKFACQTQVEMMRPGWAKDEITKEWMLVVNTDVFPQRVRTESCAQPNTPCEFIAPFYDSTCQQRYSLHRMIAIDPHDPSRSPQVAVFKFPAGCVCRVHPIKKTTTSMMMQTTLAAQQTTPIPTTIISSSTSKSIRR